LFFELVCLIVIPEMELRHLRYFIMAAEELNISRASARLNVSQPAVSRQIRDLEEELGVSLFERERVGLALTPAGEAALVHARAILRRETGLKDAMNAFRNEKRRITIRVGYLPTALPVFLADGLLRFNREHPEACVRISEMPPAAQEAALRKGEIDLALLGQPWPSLKREFSVDALHVTAVGLALPEGHRFAQRKALDLGELQSETFVSLSEKAFPTRPEMLRELFGKAGYEPRIVMKANGLSELLGMVASGIGIALVPMELDRIAPAQVAFVKLRRPQRSLIFCAAWRKDETHALVAELIAILKSSEK